MQDYKLIFIHGAYGSPRANWFPKIAKELKKINIEYAIPYCPGGLFRSFPNALKWQQIIDKQIKNTNKPVVLIGYSLGTRALLQYIETHDIQTDLLILVAPSANDPTIARRWLGRGKSFYLHKIDKTIIAQKVKKIVVMVSKEDIIAPYQGSKDLAQELDAQFIEFEGKGHMTRPDRAYDVLDVLRANLIIQ